MIVANFTSIKPEMAHSRTYEDFSKLIGERPERLGIVSRMEPYEKMTASYLTEGMGNIMKNGEKSGSKYQKINSLMFEWEVEQNHIEYIPFACDVTCDGENGMEIPMAFSRRYYEVDETFIIEGSKQMCIVIDGPIRKADDFWEYTVRLMDADIRNGRLDLDSCKMGMLTRWIGNVKQEYHDNGFTKYQSNVEKQRGYINEIRVDIDASSRYEMMEDTFIKLAKGDERNGWKSAIFKLPAMKKVLLDNFMMARNQSLLWQHTTMDANGKSVIADRQGRPIIAGDGIIPQINRFASKFNFTHLTPSILNETIMTLAQKCDSITGNTFAFVCNERMWYELQTAMSEFLANHRSDEPYIYSKGSNGYIKAGATYNAYVFGDNTVIFHPDRALSIEYPNQAYGIIVDLTADKASGRPAIEMFTIEGKQFIENTLTGVGIQSGAVATPVAGIKYVISGWQGVAVYNPYRSVVLYQNA